MYLKCHNRLKDGKEHRYWSVVESVRTRSGVIKRQLLYLGEINDTQRAQWCSALDVLEGSSPSCVKQMSLSGRPPAAARGGQSRSSSAQSNDVAPSTTVGRLLVGH